MYYTKYLKYKQKYANLKKNFINQVGGVKILLFTFNNDYERVYQYTINTPENNLNAFKNIILHNSQQCIILDNSIPITDAGYFDALSPFTVLNITTTLENIKQDIINGMIYNIPALDLEDGDQTPLRRTLSHETEVSLARLQQRKPLNLFLYDVLYSQINFYRNNRLIDCNYVQHTGGSYDTDIEVLFDTGNAAKTIISRNIVRKLGYPVIATMPKLDFRNFCINIEQLCIRLNQYQLYQHLLTLVGQTSRVIYEDEQVQPFLTLLKRTGNNIIYIQFINKLNLRVVGGVNSISIMGFETTTFQFLINGTESNFTNRNGIVIPLSVDALIADDNNTITINDKTIKTLEYYKLFIFVSDEHAKDHKMKRILQKQVARYDSIDKKLIQRNESDQSLIFNINTNAKDCREFILSKTTIKKMECSVQFYKFDINNSQIELSSDGRQFVQPNNNYKIIFDTGNAANTAINAQFVARNHTINFNPQIVMPLPEFYEFIESLIVKHNEDVQLLNILQRWRDQRLTSAEIYAEFMGSIPQQIQRYYDNFLIYYLQLEGTVDVHENKAVSGGIKYTFHLKIAGCPHSIPIEAFSAEKIMPINVLQGTPPQPSPAVSYDILISVIHTKELNKKMCFIGNLQDKRNTETIIEALNDQLNNLNTLRMIAIVAQFDTVQFDDEIAVLQDNIRTIQERKYPVEVVPCSNDILIPKKFYENIILIAHRKLKLILYYFNEKFRPIFGQFGTGDLRFSLTDLQGNYKKEIAEAANFTEYIQKILLVDINRFTVTQLHDIIIRLQSKKGRFITALQKAVDTANTIREKVSQATPVYRIRDDFA